MTLLEQHFVTPRMLYLCNRKWSEIIDLLLAMLTVFKEAQIYEESIIAAIDAAVVERARIDAG